MIHTTSELEPVRRLFTPSPRGIVGFVDDLLEFCRDRQLAFDFRDDHCVIRSFESSGEVSIEVPIPKAVFRAVLARVAALCNDRMPNSVTPYRGRGELSVGGDKPASFRASFTNTPDEQRLELCSVASSAGGANAFNVPVKDERPVAV